MGGYNSSRWHGEATRQTVESSLTLSVDRLRRVGALREPPALGWLSGALTWPTNEIEQQAQSIGYRVEWSGAAILFRLRYTTNGHEVDEPIEIEQLRQHFGGARWWFRCPLVKRGRECRRSCGRLYLPPGARLFGCRQCYNLTYQSSNESRQFSALFAAIAQNTGLSPSAVEKALRPRGAAWGGI